MKIVVENVSEGEIIPYPLLLLKGRVENLDMETMKEISSPSKRKRSNVSQAKKFFLTHRADGAVDQVRTVQIFGGKFKILIKLHPGSNIFEFEFCRIFKHLSVYFDPPSTEWHPHRIGLVYIVCANTDGSFQAPPGASNDIESACKKLSLAGALIQCFLADSLDAHGLSSTLGRKTVQFARLPSNISVLEEFFPIVYVHYSKLSIEEAHHMNPEELWEFHAKELVSQHFGKVDRIKFLAITNATRYSNPTGIEPQTYDAVLSLTKGHVALGGGGLGLFGSGCLHTWPENLEQVQEQFLDQKLIDKKSFMDDSAYRGTVGGCFSTTLGGLIHELGHMLDLGHTENGIMSRGCDDVDKFFTLSSNAPTQAKIAAQSKRHLLLNCSRHSASLARGVTSPNQENLSKTTLKREGSSYLEEYQRKKYYRKMVQDCGGAFWNRSSAIILSCHKWLNPSDPGGDCSDLRYDDKLNTLESDFEVLIVEFRDRFGTVVKFIEPDTETRTIDLNLVFRQQDLMPKSIELLAVNSNGTIFKRKY